MEKSGKSKRDAKGEKLREQRIEEQVLSSLESAGTLEERFRLLLNKHVESERDSKRMRQELKLHERQLESVQREKENLQREYNKGILMRDKLQEVCREQQKLIKSVKNESLQKLREEEERRKESQTKFQASLNEITQSLSKNNDENLKLRDHNIEMSKKLKFLAEQYQLREQQLEKLNEQVQLETQLHVAKMNKVQMEAAMEKEILTKEKQIALEKLLQTQKMLKELTEREKVLKEQLNLYTAKYDDFQSSLQKSNETFMTYKAELEKMSKQTRKLEKECLDWKRKWERSNATVIELATEKQERDEHAARCNRQVEQLQKLLRALQTERTQLHKLLRDNKIECPPLPALPAEPEPISTSLNNVADKDRIDMMSKNCAELKETLNNLQNQVKNLNLRGSELDAPSQASQTKQGTQTGEDNSKKRQKRKQKAKNNRASGGQQTKTAETNGVEVKPNESVETQTTEEIKEPSEPVTKTDESSPAEGENVEIETAANGKVEEENLKPSTENQGACSLELLNAQENLIEVNEISTNTEESISLKASEEQAPCNGAVGDGMSNNGTDDLVTDKPVTTNGIANENEIANTNSEIVIVDKTEDAPTAEQLIKSESENDKVEIVNGVKSTDPEVSSVVAVETVKDLSNAENVETVNPPLTNEPLPN